MYQQELARSGKRLFFIRGTYIYITIAISVLIAWCSKDWGPFQTAFGDCAWFWLSLGVASAGPSVPDAHAPSTKVPTSSLPGWCMGQPLLQP